MSKDEQRLLLVDDAGAEFTVDIDARLRAALRGDSARLGQLEIQMDSTLRPRDIQARIRAGESPEEVAQAAQTSVERIMTYAAPVLAEREHVAERAQRSSIRRRAGEGASSARTLGEAVGTHLRALNVDPGSVEWDAWRREDGRWSLTGRFTSAPRRGTGQFTYDAPGNFVVLENEEARWLVGEVEQAPETPAPRDDLQQARERRLGTAAPEDELPLGEDALDLVSEPEREPDRESTLDLTETAAAIRGLELEQPLEAYLEDPAEAPQDTEDTEDTEPVEAPEPAPHDPAADEPPARRPVKKNRGRASVPSWDEIMFGGGKPD